MNEHDLNIQELDLTCNQIKDLSGLNIQNNTKLEVLDLRGNNMTSLKGFVPNDELEKIYLEGNPIPQTEIDQFKQKYPSITVFF